MNLFILFSKVNLFKRDKKKCQYCGKKLTLHTMTIDHVIPKCEGGLTRWENVVCCCSDCNLKKGGNPPEKVGMTLKRKPFAPKNKMIVKAKK